MKRTSKRIRLRTKFLLLFGIISMVPLLFTLLLTYGRFQKTLEQDSATLETQLATTASVKIKSFIVSQIGILDTIATLYDQQFSVRGDLSNKIVENILYRSENFNDISIVDKNGKEIIKQDRLLVFLPQDLKDLGDTEAFKTVKEKGLYIGPMYVENGKPLFDMGRWISDSQGNFSGAVFAQVDAGIMPEVMSNISDIAGPGGRVFMVNKQGVVVAHSDLSYILGERDLSELPPVANIVSGNPNITGSIKYVNENGQTVIGSAFPVILDLPEIRLPEPFQIDWYVIVEQQESAILAEANQAALFFIFISLTVLLLIIVASIYFAQRISAPVESLYKATEEFKKGNLAYRTKIKSNDEIGDLALNFDRMADSVSGSIEHLKAMEKTKSEFVTIAAHQLRTPLTGMKWSLDFILKGESGKLTTDQKKIVSDLTDATDRMIELVNDLLNISQIEEGRFGIVLTSQHIEPIVDRVKKTFDNLVDKKGVILKVEMDKSLPPVNMDAEKLEMAISNLINNSVKYSKPNSEILLKLSGGNALNIEVKDQGIGISKEESEKIFTKFFRSKRALLYHTDGTGLGLYVCKNIIDQHGGKIWFESKEGEGTTFFISLPEYNGKN